MATTLIRIINNRVIILHSPEKNAGFVTNVARACNGKWNRSQLTWSFDISYKDEVIAGAHEYFSEITTSDETVQVIDRKSDTRRKIILGAAVMNYVKRMRNSGPDCPETEAFIRQVDELIEDISSPKDKMLFTAEVI